MTMTVSAKKADGTFSYEVYNGNVLIEAGDGYPTKNAAEHAARACYNELHKLKFEWGQPFFQNDYVSLEEIYDLLGV